MRVNFVVFVRLPPYAPAPVSAIGPNVGVAQQCKRNSAQTVFSNTGRRARNSVVFDETECLRRENAKRYCRARDRVVFFKRYVAAKRLRAPAKYPVGGGLD